MILYLNPRSMQTVESRGYMDSGSDGSLGGEDTPLRNDGGAALLAISE